MSVVTKTGDAGTTQVKGLRVRKNNPQIDAIGDIDELNSWIGKIVSETDQIQDRNLLTRVQLFLFDLGSIVSGYMTTDVSADLLSTIERFIGVREGNFPQQRHFLIPQEASDIHIARSVARRCERSSLDFLDNFPNAYKTLNRLSDWLFLLAKGQTKTPTWTNLNEKGFHQVFR